MEIVAGVIVLGIIVVLLVSCRSAPVKSYVGNYIEADNSKGSQSIESVQSQVQLRDRFKNLELLFSDLKHPDLEQRIRATYANELYFNDTFRTLDNQDELVEYLKETADRVNSTTTEFKEFAYGNNSYYVRWTMHIEFDVSGKSIVTDSIGVSQIRFDENGLISFHQDFWDNTEGFFQHLPVVGFLLGKVKNRL